MIRISALAARPGRGTRPRAAGGRCGSGRASAPPSRRARAAARPRRGRRGPDRPGARPRSRSRCCAPAAAKLGRQRRERGLHVACEGVHDADRRIGRWQRPSSRGSGRPTSCATRPGEPALLYIDLHLVHEVTSPQAFEGLRLAGRTVRRPDLTVATMDHNVPTLPGPIERPARARPARRAARELRASSASRSSRPARGREGIVHVIGPELGLTQPGMTDRLRRQPHLDARRVRRARDRHRHVRGRARARDPDAAAAQAADDARSTSSASSRSG